MRIATALSLLVLGAGCSPVYSSAYATGRLLPPSTSPVTISATRDPAGADPVGVIEVHGRVPLATLEALVTEFGTRVASMGGNYGRIDKFATTHDMVTESYDYDCGSTETEFETRTVTSTGPDGSITTSFESVPVTKHVPKTCTGERQVEVATITLVGRAFRARGEN